MTDDDPRGAVMDEKDLNAYLEMPFFRQQAELMRNPAFRSEMSSMLEAFKEIRMEHGDGTEGASQRMDNFEFMVTSLMKMGEEGTLDDIPGE